MPAEQYPTLLASYASKPKQMGFLTKAIADLEGAVASGAVPNPVFVNAKSVLSSALDQAYRTAIVDPYLHGKYDTLSKEENDLFWLSTAPQLHTISSWEKRLLKLPSTPVVDASKAFIAEIKPLAEMVAKAKGMIVKRQPKAPEEDVRVKYQAPSASKDGMKMVYDLLVSITESAKDKLVSQIKERYERIVKQFLALQDEYDAMSPEEQKKKYPRKFDRYACYRDNKRAMNMEAYEVVGLCTKTRYDLTKRRDVYELEDDADQRITERAEKMAEDIRMNFVTKNLKKIASIVERKGNLTDATVVGQTISAQGLEGIIKLTFADGSLFTCRNSVVLAYSVHGTPFLRFPLTFHNVFFADGTKMKQPSEEKMNTEFI